MAVVVLTSAAGGTGVTSVALGLTLAWPTSVLLVDADRIPTQTVLAGYLQGHDPGRRGLASVLQACRERRPVEPVLDHDSLPLSLDVEPTRRFLPGFPHPAMVRLFSGSWPDFAGALSSHSDDVVVDAGQIGAEGLPAPLTRVADTIVVVTRTSLAALAALRLYLPLVVDEAGDQKTRLLLIGPGRPYDRAEISKQFGLASIGSLEWNPEAARVFSEGLPAPRRFDDTQLMRGLRQVAHTVVDRASATRELIGAPR